jgi:YfiH family protein
MATVLPHRTATSAEHTPIAPGHLLVPGWDAYPWLHAAFSTRSGGITSAYGYPDDQNLGWTAQDDPAAVAENRRRFIAAVLGQPVGPEAPSPLVTIRQIHGQIIRTVPANPTEPLATPDDRAVLEGDGLLTQATGLLLGVQTADCVPVLVADTRTRAVAAFHAGWRGTLAQIVAHGIARMAAEFGSRPADLIAAIGPAIRPCCFAIGDEVRAAFTAEFDYAPELFSQHPALHMDLHQANLRQLLVAGLRPAAITVLAECSACTRLRAGESAPRRKYFSYRAEHGITGRMLSVIGTTTAL